MANCALSCTLESYTYSLSSIEFVKKDENITDTDTGSDGNDIEFHLYFEQFEQTTYAQVSTVTLDSVVGEIGGSMGIFLGASFVTCIELILFLAQFVQSWFEKLIGRESPAQDSQDMKVVNEKKRVCQCRLPHCHSDTLGFRYNLARCQSY